MDGEYHGKSQGTGSDYGWCIDPIVYDFHHGYAPWN
jgi:hypothetical protein